MNKTIALITASILAAGVLGIVSNTGSVYAAQTTGTATLGGGLNTQASTGLIGSGTTGQAGASAFQQFSVSGLPPVANLQGQSVSSAASDTQTVNTGSGNTNCVTSSSQAGTCAATHAP